VATKFVSERNLKFLLYEVFDIEALTQYDYYRDHNKKTFDMVLKEGLRLAKDLLHPSFEEMDRKPPELVDGQVKVHPSVRTVLKEFAEGGWLTAQVPYDHDGEQLPQMLDSACSFVFGAANYSASVYPGLIVGASHLIESFGSHELYDTYVPRMRSGKWQGTMALTEPEAGSSLSDLSSTAEPTDKGHYLIKGQKVFISAGDHDGAENVIHLMLAKIPGGPPGVKGISLFVVPKKRLDEKGNLVSNDVVTSGVYHKMGYKGCPIAQLSFGDKADCRGWLVGEAHQGLRYMFQMMNESRIGVGSGATSIASAAYYASLEYAKTRRQGRKLSAKNPAADPVPIIEHPDVKRMLLFERVVVEGSLSLVMQCSRYVDMQRVLDEKDAEKYALLLEILTPIVKTYPSEMGILSVSSGLQCLGGSGYCDDYTLEQHFRDSRIHPIHEGTTGIQGMDLLGRKVTMKNGRAWMLYLEELAQTISQAGKISDLKEVAGKLDDAVNQLKTTTQFLMGLAVEKGPEIFLADATLYLEFFGIVTIAWQWLLQGVAIQKALQGGAKESDMNFYGGKMAALKFFYNYELPKILGLQKRLMNPDGLTVEMDAALFND
jgi:alkylation response protein AidB-like acyl-CoA dehydrogenase